jgi:glucose/arabinose dehydrogenase
VTAAVIGTTIGALAGVWSAYWVTPVGRPVAQVATTKTVAESSSGSAGVKTVEPSSRGREPQPPPRTRVAAPAPPGSALTAPASAAKVLRTSGADEVLERARALAQRPDVKALIALREIMVLRATARGEQDSPAAKAQLDALDRYLDEARMLRLKIDAVELQKSAPHATPADKQPSARR